MISHPRIAAWYENEVKGNKEGIAYITKTRSHVTFENSAKEVKNLKLLGFTQTSIFEISVGLHCLAAFSNLSFLNFWKVCVPAVLGTLNSF
jgi:hypothetical protein